MSLTIGNVKIKGNLILGPMAGVTDLPFRLLCKEKGADLVFTEMISAKGILYNNRNTEGLLMISEQERPAAVQLFGSDPDILCEMAKRIEDRNFDILDINMGCPVPKVVNNGEGSALMKDPRRVGEIVRKVSEGIRKPVTVKIRKGFGKRGGSGEDCTGKRGRGNHCACQNQAAVLQRKGGLGDHPQRQGSGKHSGDRKR